MKTHAKGVIAVVGGVVLAGSLVACGYHYRSPEARADHVAEEITEELELTSTQITQLETLKTDLLKLRREMEKKHETSHNTFETLFDQPTLDQQKMLALVTDYTQFINDNAPALIASTAAFYDSLAPEQQSELREMIQKHKKRHQWHH